MSRQNLPKQAPSNAAKLLRLFGFLAIAIIIGTIVTVLLLPGRTNALSTAQAAYLAGDYQGAIEAFNTAIGQNPSNAEAFIGRGLAYLQMGNLEGARGDFLHANTLVPDDSRPLFQLGLIALNNSQYPGAIDYFTRTLELNPNHALAYANRAYAHGLNGNYSAAIADYNAAIALDNTDAEFYRGLGDAHYELDNTTEALAAYQRYAELVETVDATVLQRLADLQSR